MMIISFRIFEAIDQSTGWLQLLAYSSHYADDTGEGGAGALAFSLYTADIYSVDARKYFPTGTWGHMAFAYDDSTRLGTVYCNGTRSY